MHRNTRGACARARARARSLRERNQMKMRSRLVTTSKVMVVEERSPPLCVWWGGGAVGRRGDFPMEGRRAQRGTQRGRGRTRGRVVGVGGTSGRRTARRPSDVTGSRRGRRPEGLMHPSPRFQPLRKKPSRCLSSPPPRPLAADSLALCR